MNHYVEEEIILGFGKTQLSPRGTPKIDVIVAEFKDNNMPDRKKCRIETLDAHYAQILQIHSAYNDPLAIRKIRSRHKSKSFQWQPEHHLVVRYGSIQQINNIIRKYDNPALDALINMNVLFIKEKNIVIPCATIASYYLGHTSLINTAFHSPNIYESDLFDYSKSALGFNTPIIKLNPATPFKLAPHIARICIDQHAHKIYSEIKDKSMHSTDGYEPSLFMKPLASGNRKWKTKGFYIEDLFVVVQIISCDMPFPFSKLLIQKDKVKYIGEGNKDIERPHRRHFGKPPENLPDQQLLINQDVDISINTTELEAKNLKSTYPGLKHINLHHINNTTIKDKRSNVNYELESSILINHLSAGGDQLNKDIQVIKTTVSTLEDVEADYQTDLLRDFDSSIDRMHEKLALFRQAITFLESHRNYHVTEIFLGNCRPKVKPYNENIIPYTYVRETIYWCRKRRITKDKADNALTEWQIIGRRFIAYVIEKDYDSTLLVEFIYNKSKNKSKDTGRILVIPLPDDQDEPFMLQCITSYADDRGSWPKDELISISPGITTLKHQGTTNEETETPESLANRILQKIIT